MNQNDEAKTYAMELGALPCPFCGSKPMANGFMFHLPRADDNGKRAGSAVCCSNPSCRASTSAVWNDEAGIKLAVERWNCRVKPKETKGDE